MIDKKIEVDYRIARDVAQALWELAEIRRKEARDAAMSVEILPFGDNDDEVTNAALLCVEKLKKAIEFEQLYDVINKAVTLLEDECINDYTE